jgi:lysine-ketoglutarate reductase/saccharopine dehydrogenase-like protein (TIGR00300 family)
VAKVEARLEAEHKLAKGLDDEEKAKQIAGNYRLVRSAIHQGEHLKFYNVKEFVIDGRAIRVGADVKEGSEYGRWFHSLRVGQRFNASVKMHVLGSTSADYMSLRTAVLPYLAKQIDEGGVHHFKMFLEGSANGQHAKTFTIYPVPERVSTVATELDDILKTKGLVRSASETSGNIDDEFLLNAGRGSRRVGVVRDFWPGFVWRGADGKQNYGAILDADLVTRLQARYGKLTAQTLMRVEHDCTKDQCVPDDFYSTTNHRTMVRHQGQWLSVDGQRMDAVICLEGSRALCRKLRDVRQGDKIVCGTEGIRVMPEFKERDRLGFAFMSNDISSERRVETAVRKIADMMRQVKAQAGKIVFVAGPVVVHTGGVEYLGQLIRGAYVDVLLSGNALAVHDIENALFGTSLGVDLERGLPIYEGHKNHMRAINAINQAGGIEPAVNSGVLKSGIMYECVKHRVPFVLAGSIRDDGPLPETIMDLVVAQDEYARQLKGASLVICLSSMLHSIATGNMLPSWVRTVCVDINPAVVTKLSDRGSSQAVGVVTDVGLFLNLLANNLAG